MYSLKCHLMIKRNRIRKTNLFKRDKVGQYEYRYDKIEFITRTILQSG